MGENVLDDAVCLFGPEIRLGPVAPEIIVEPDVDTLEGSYLALLDQLLGGHEAGGERVVVDGENHQSCASLGVADPLASLDGLGQGLLAEDVLPSLDGLEDQALVESGRGVNGDGFHLGIGQELFRVGVAPLGPRLPPDPLHPLPV